MPAAILAALQPSRPCAKYAQCMRVEAGGARVSAASTGLAHSGPHLEGTPRTELRSREGGRHSGDGSHACTGDPTPQPMLVLCTLGAGEAEGG